MRRFLQLVVLLFAGSTLAQKEDIFGKGKPPAFHEETVDKRFNKSKVAKLLSTGTDHPACVELLGGLLVALAEIGPSLHKRDENFFLDPELVNAVNQQLSTPNFPAMSYLVAMVRRVMIDGRLPDEWLETAKALNTQVKIIDLARLKQLNDGVRLVDSAYFQIPLLKQRYYVEVVGANSAVTTDVARTFHADYVDREVAWGNAILLDAGLNVAKGKKPKASQLTEVVAILEYVPPDPRKKELDLTGKRFEPPPPIRIIAKLAPKQYLDLEKVFRGQRMMVKGRFWEMNRTLTEVEVDNAVLFDDRDWSNGVMLGNPAEIAACPAAVNDMLGLSPQQPGGFKH